MRFAILGCGHMGSAIVQALLAKQHRIHAGNPTKPHLSLDRQSRALFTWTRNNVEAISGAEIIVIAVKPFDVESVVKEIRPSLQTHQIILSIAAGIPLRKLQKFAGGHKKIARVMPNLPAQVLEGMSVWKATENISKGEKSTIKKLLGAFGKEIEVQDEKLIDMATAISGGGPAFTAAFLESMSRVAEKIGYRPADARTLALQAVYGSAVYLQKTGIEFGELKRAVQTKGGTTEAGFQLLKAKKWQEIFEKALEQSRKRAEELGSLGR